MTRGVPRATLLAVVIAALAGCGVDDPYAAPTRPAEPRSAKATTPPSSAPSARPTPPIAPARERGQRSARAAASRFARAWTNWSWDTIATRQRALGALATGDLRRTLRASAAASARNARLRSDRSAQTGRVVAIDVQPGATGRTAVVVVSEQSLSHGRDVDEGQRYAVYRAIVIRRRDGWFLSEWSSLTP